MRNNKYLKVTPYADQDAAYVGQWTAAIPGGLLCIEIFKDGTGKYCQNNLKGEVQKMALKIYRQSGEGLYMINESGMRFKIREYSDRHIKMTAYGGDSEFERGIKSTYCKDFFVK
ncbi:MAG: hypothetical protein Q8P24_19625 [Desulfobacterales bacterium]|nr:hypothetical protein [Desulfobacterales bacterium]